MNQQLWNPLAVDNDCLGQAPESNFIDVFESFEPPSKKSRSDYGLEESDADFGNPASLWRSADSQQRSFFGAEATNQQQSKLLTGKDGHQDLQIGTAAGKQQKKRQFALLNVNDFSPFHALDEPRSSTTHATCLTSPKNKNKGSKARFRSHQAESWTEKFEGM